MLRVFIRHVDYDHLHLEEGVRLFVAEKELPRDDGQAPERRIEGFVLADPLWQDGRVTGYVISLNRMRRDGHHGEELFRVGGVGGSGCWRGGRCLFSTAAEPELAAI